MLSVNFFCLIISVIVGIASANPVANPSQSFNEIIDYSTDLVIPENPLPFLLQSIGALTGYQKSVLSTAVDIISWLASNFFYLVTAAVISFCRLSNLCMGLEEYLPIITTTVTQVLTPENLEMAGRVLVSSFMGYYYEGRE